MADNPNIDPRLTATAIPQIPANPPPAPSNPPPAPSNRPPAQSNPPPTTFAKPQSSPWIHIPDERFICIEHPGIIQNIDRAIATLGGQQALETLAKTNADSGLQLRWRPDDRMQPPIKSRTVATNNLLVKVTVKRRRKRRRDAEGNIIPGPPPEDEGMSLMEKIKQNNGNYTVEALGRVDKTIRFREMADFEWNPTTLPFAEKLNDTLLRFDYEGIKSFTLSKDRGQTDLPLLPPPQFSNAAIPHIYHYRQNPAIKKSLVNGKATLLNFQAGPKTFTPIINAPDAIIPTRPTELTPYEQLDPITKQCVDHLAALFARRPIWTRRALFNHFPKKLQPMVRFAMAHVAYMWRAGPWRDACVAYGIDPRLDPEYRFYQTVFFQMDAYKPNPALPEVPESETHIFNGKQISHDGRCFQMCDVTDPLVRGVIDTPDLRRKCHPIDGWYRYSTIAKIKTLMRMKIRDLAGAEAAAEEDYLDVVNAESESEEAEERRLKEEEEARKTKGERGGRRGAKKGRTGGRPQAYLMNKTQMKRARARRLGSNKEGEGEGDEGGDAGEEEDEEEAAEGAAEWEEELAPDERVERFMQEYAKAGGDEMAFDVEDDDEGEFDILGEDDEEE